MKTFVGIVLALVVGSSSPHHVVAAASSLVVESLKMEEEEAKKASLRGRSLYLGCAQQPCEGGGGGGIGPSLPTNAAPPVSPPTLPPANFPSSAPSETPSAAPTAAPTTVPTIGPTTAPPTPYWEDITFDNFEDGWGNFEDTDNSVAVDPSDSLRMSNPNQSQWVYQGDAALRIRDDSGVESSVWHKDDHDVTGYDNLGVRFWYSSRDFNSNESFVLEYSSDGGSSYSVMKEFVYQDDFENDDFNVAVVNFNANGLSYALTNQARIRFRCTASGDGDKIYIDKVRFMGHAKP